MRVRVLLAKMGLDGHERGVDVVAYGLREAGMEVIYTGMRQTAEMVARTALQESVDVIGVSSLSGAHMELFPLLFQELRAKRLNDVIVIAGGVIPEADRPALHEMGVRAIFGPGTFTADIVKFIVSAVSDAGPDSSSDIHAAVRGDRSARR